MPTLPHHHATSARVRALAEKLFAFLDDHARLSSHMTRSSWMMGRGRMQIEFDDGRGQRIGSRIRLAGRVFGIELSLDEVVTERNPPYRKVWETIGAPKLLVIGHYRMGFEITTQGNDSALRVFIDYALPEAPPARWLGYMLGRYYARWCTQRMAKDAMRHFALVAKRDLTQRTSGVNPAS
ncbi:MAG TPA: SRPBCC family protein [Candidatus Binatia bacterium]|jgi:hypothetical protein